MAVYGPRKLAQVPEAGEYGDAVRAISHVLPSTQPVKEAVTQTQVELLTALGYHLPENGRYSGIRENSLSLSLSAASISPQLITAESFIYFSLRSVLSSHLMSRPRPHSKRPSRSVAVSNRFDA